MTLSFNNKQIIFASTIADIILTIKDAGDATNAVQLLYPNPIEDAAVDYAGDFGQAIAFIYENLSYIEDNVAIAIQEANAPSTWNEWADPFGYGLGYDGEYGSYGDSSGTSFGSGSDFDGGTVVATGTAGAGATATATAAMGTAGATAAATEAAGGLETSERS
jgi:hypothetical protein